jgi:opacity protein-like surface antigen
MRKISAFLAVVIIAAVGLQAQETKTLRVKVQVANVRAEPDMNSAVVKQVNLGTLLESRQKIGDWFGIMVTDDKGTAMFGYINSSAVDVISIGGTKPAAQTGPPPVAQTGPPPAAEVQGRWPSIMIFGRYGSFSPSDENFKTIYGSGSVFGGEFRVHVAGGFYISLDGGYFKKKGALTVTQEETTMTLYPIDAMVVFHALSGYVLPYVGAGGAVCKYTEENVIGTVDKWGLGFAVCGGVTARWRFLGLDARVKYSSVKIKPLEDEAGLGGLTLSIAAGVVF